MCPKSTDGALLVPEEHVLSTLERDGSRNWLYPRLSKGRYWRARRAVGWMLITIFVLLPFLRIGGKPAILLDITARQFTLFGFTFLPTDTLLLALFMVGVFLTIFLATAAFGRIWCGWACPQTVYLEFVYRPIERILLGTAGRGGVPRQVPGWRRVALYAIYAVISMGLAHTFLAYFVGTDRLRVWITQSPIEHPYPFLVMAATTVLMMFDFSYFREQLCLIACPYGRFQSVLLDRGSLIVAYDSNRGEPRGKRSTSDGQSGHGDCVDCGLCVRTCPTGIDIRNGLQMECVNCTQCMDACDEIMDKLERPRGLIRYASQNALEGQKQWLRPRLFVYPTAITIVVTAFFAVLLSKQSFDAVPLRRVGQPFVIAADQRVQNVVQIKLTNRGETPDLYSIRVAGPVDATILESDESVSVEPGAMVTHPLLLSAPRESFQGGELQVDLVIENRAGERREIPWRMLGPY